jgi:hypothetical protein
MALRMDHHPCSPNLATSNFYLLETLKRLNGKGCNTHPREASCRLLPTDTWYWYLPHWEISVGAMAVKILKCHWWLNGGLMCTMCCHVPRTYLSHKVIGIRLFVTLFSKLLSGIKHSTYIRNCNNYTWKIRYVYIPMCSYTFTLLLLFR